MLKRVKIASQRVVLQPLKESDATEEYCQWLNDPTINRYLGTKGTTIAGLKEYIKAKNSNPNCLFLGIFFKEGQEHIGNIKLEPIDLKKGTATVGILIGNKDYWGRGLATEATKLLTDYAFSKLKLKKIDLAVDARNRPAIKVYQKAGFKVASIDKENQAVFMVKNNK